MKLGRPGAELGPERMGALVALRGAGRTWSDIAAILGVSVGAVRYAWRNRTPKPAPKTKPKTRRTPRRAKRKD